MIPIICIFVVLGLGSTVFEWWFGWFWISEFGC